jgi:hypothetical protein
MLVVCPSCGKRVSDRVAACPFCQAAIRSDAVPPAPSGAPARIAPSLPRPSLDPPPPPKKTSPLVYVALGCGLIVILGFAAAGTGFYFVKRKADEIREQGSNPELRNRKAVEVLQADRLPDGYHTSAVVSIPGMDMVMLGDQAPRPNGHASPVRERGFIYMRLFREPENMRALRAFVEGRTDDASALRANRVDLATTAILRRGSLRLGAGNVLYCAQRGEMSASGGRQQGLQTVTLIDCPDQNMRLGVWFGPDPDPARPPAELNLTGTVADENEVRSFLSHFKVCGS